MKTSSILNELIENLQVKLSSKDLNKYIVILTFDDFWVGVLGNNVSTYLDKYCKCYKITKLKL